MNINILNKIVDVPEGATSFHTTEDDSIVFLIGRTGYFVTADLTNYQVDKLRAADWLGSFGQEISYT